MRFNLQQLISKLLICAVVCSLAVSATAQGREVIHKGDVAVVPLRGEVAPSLLAFLRRAVKTAENNEASAAINDAFRRLSVEQQSLLWLREVEGQSYAELAEILDIPVGTIRSRLFAAREELRRIWHGAPGKTRNRP